MEKLPLGTKKLPKQEYFAQSGRTAAEDGRQLVLKKTVWNSSWSTNLNSSSGKLKWSLITPFWRQSFRLKTSKRTFTYRETLFEARLNLIYELVHLSSKIHIIMFVCMDGIDRKRLLHLIRGTLTKTIMLLYLGNIAWRAIQCQVVRAVISGARGPTFNHSPFLKLFSTWEGENENLPI